MATLLNTNLRGTRISPENKANTIHYYQCVIDQPAGWNVGENLFYINEAAQTDTEIHIIYLGVLQDPSPDQAVVTYILPVITSQRLQQPDGDNLKIIVTDSDGNTASGNPNRGKPPVVTPVDRSETLTPTIIIFQSESNSDNYFVGVIANTFINEDGVYLSSGYGPYFPLIPDTENPTQLSGTLALVVQDDPGAVAAMGSISSKLNQYTSVVLQEYTVSSDPVAIDYETIHPI
jgi:hypothetical protein